MDNATTGPQIPESFFEHRQVFATPWVERWMVLPNPFLSALIPPLRSKGVDLVDFSFNNNAANLGEIVFNIAIRKWNAAIRIALDSVTFIAVNPNWQEAPQLVEVFDLVSSQIRGVTGVAPMSQESSLSFHVTPGPLDFGKATANLVRENALGDGVFYGVSRYRRDGVLAIDKSVRYENAVFVRLQRTFPGDALLADVAMQLYQDEIAALHLLGIPDVP